MTFLFLNVFDEWMYGKRRILYVRYLIIIFGTCKVRRLFLSNFGASLQAFEPNMMRITSRRNVISIKNASGAVYVVFWLVLPLRDRNNLTQSIHKHILKLYCIFKFLTHKIVFFAKSQASLGLILYSVVL